MSDWLLTPLLIKADLIWAATDPDDRQHLLGAVPTGYGKSLPMLVAALLLPPGEPASQMFSGQCKLLQISDGVVNIVSQTFRFQGAC